MGGSNPATSTPMIEESSCSSVPQPPITQATITPANILTMDSQTLQITQHNLNGRNFREWFQSVTLVIKGKGKFDYLTGAIPTPPEVNRIPAMGSRKLYSHGMANQLNGIKDKPNLSIFQDCKRGVGKQSLVF